MAFLPSFLPSFLFSFRLLLLIAAEVDSHAGGPAGRGLIPSVWTFCQRLVPFCVMVLTEWTPHLTPIEQMGLGGRDSVASVLTVVI